MPLPFFKPYCRSQRQPSTYDPRSTNLLTCREVLTLCPSIGSMIRLTDYEIDFAVHRCKYLDESIKEERANYCENRIISDNICTNVDVVVEDDWVNDDWVNNPAVSILPEFDGLRQRIADFNTTHQKTWQWYGDVSVFFDNHANMIFVVANVHQDNNLEDDVSIADTVVLDTVDTT